MTGETPEVRSDKGRRKKEKKKEREESEEREEREGREHSECGIQLTMVSGEQLLKSKQSVLDYSKKTAEVFEVKIHALKLLITICSCPEKGEKIGNLTDLETSPLQLPPQPSSFPSSLYHLTFPKGSAPIKKQTEKNYNLSTF